MSSSIASARPKPRSARRVLLSFIAVFAARGLGLVLGLAVAVLLANRLGATTSTDAFFLARRLTLGTSDAIRRVIANGYIPAVVADLRQRGQRAAVLLWRRRFCQLLLAAVAMAIAVALGARQVIALVAPGFSADTAAEAVFLLRILAFMIPISLVLAALATFLLASRRFGLPEAMSELPRVLTVSALLILIPPFGVTVLALALLVGAGLAASSLAIIVWRQVRREPPTGSPTADPAGHRSPGRVLPAALMHVYGQAAPWIAFGFASTLGAGSISILEYGIRLTTLLPSVLVTSFVSVAYTELAHRSDAPKAQLSANVMRSLRAAAFIVLPLVTLIAVSAEVMVDLVLKHGVFDDASAQETAMVIRFYSPAVAMGVMINILLIGIYADPEAPHLKIALWATAVGLVLRVMGMMVAIQILGLFGLPLAASVADAAVLTLVGMLVLRHWPSFVGRQDILALAAILLATAVSGAVGYLVLQALATPGEIWRQIVALGSAAGAAGGVYLLAATLLRIPEIKVLRDQLPIGRRRRDAPAS